MGFGFSLKDTFNLGAQALHDPTGGIYTGADATKRTLGKLRGGGSHSSTYAADTFAALTRDQWATYVSTFVPLENQLIDYATDAARPDQAMAEASTRVNAAFDAQQGATDRRLRGLGVALDADEQAAQRKSYGLARSLADVGAQNLARDLTVRRQQSVLGNPAPQGVMAQGGM